MDETGPARPSPEVRPIPGQAHLPWAEVHFDELDEAVWCEASRRAAELGKTGLEAWTTEDRPATIAFLADRGYEEVRRYLRFELDVGGAPEPAAEPPPGIELTTLAERPELVDGLWAVAVEAYPDQPGQADTTMPADGLESFRAWGVDPHPPQGYVLALADGRVVGFGYVEVDGDAGRHGMTGVARDRRGRGVADAIKRAQIAWAKRAGLATLRTENEVRIPAMRVLNERYGYRPIPAEVVLRGPLASYTGSL